MLPSYFHVQVSSPIDAADSHDGWDKSHERTGCPCRDSAQPAPSRSATAAAAAIPEAAATAADAEGELGRNN